MRERPMPRFRFIRAVRAIKPIHEICTAVFFVGFAVTLGAQEAAPPPIDPARQAPTLSVTTHEVLLDVVVTDGGQAVSGLKASDFTVLEDGRLQVVASLAEHGPMTAAMNAQAASHPALPPNTFTNCIPAANTNAYTVILLDALNTRLDDQMSVRLALIKYLKHMQPGGPVAIFERDTKMHLVQGFTSDPQVLAAAAESERDRPAMPNVVRATREEYLEYRINEVSMGFELLGRYLAAFPGRKNLIWFTGALPQTTTLAPMGNPFNDEFKLLEGDPHDLTAALTLSRVAVYPIDSRGLQAAPQYSAATNRPPATGANIQFETGQAFQHLALDSIAESTGGRAYYNSNGLGAKITEIEDNGSIYYTLTYATTNKNWNGELRHIKVELKQAHGKLQYRQGYYAVDRTKQEQAELTDIEKAQQSDGARDDGQTAVNGTETQAGKNEKAETPKQGIASTSNASKVGPPSQAGPPKEGFEEAMMLGAVPPTEIVFTAHVSEGGKVEQLRKEDAWPQDNYLAADWKFKPFHTYAVEFTADAKTLQLTKGPDGLRHGSIAFVSVVYDQMAQNVNSRLTTKNLDIDEAQYQDLLLHGLTEHHEIAVPAKGSYFLRLGLHDTVNDRIGSFEVALDQVKPEVVGAVAQNK
jgi:VWFA-related protein